MAPEDARWHDDRSTSPHGGIPAITNPSRHSAFGPEGKNFPKFVAALRPNENGDAPTPAMVFEAAMLKMDAVEPAWRKWVQGGMVVKW